MNELWSAHLLLILLFFMGRGIINVIIERDRGIWESEERLRQATILLAETQAEIWVRHSS